AGAVAAQSPAASPGASPNGSPPAGDVSKVPHPAHIHTGTCANLGDIVAPLNDVTMIQGSDWCSASETEAARSSEDMLKSPHAIMAHASAEQIGVYIACADLTGDPSSKQLTVALDDQNESGFYGVAFLEKTDGKTQVDLSLTAPEGGFVPPAAEG